MASNNLPSGESNPEAAKTHFKNGEAISKNNNDDVFGAYSEFHVAVELDPKNRKYQKRLVEVAQAASAAAETKGRTLLNSEPAAAAARFKDALSYDPSNQSAADDLSALDSRIQAARQDAEKAREALNNGDDHSAQKLLDPIKAFSTLAPAIVAAKNELVAVRLTQQAAAEWNQQDQEAALRDIASAEKEATQQAYVSKESHRIRASIANSLLSKGIPDSSTLKGIIEALGTADQALAIDSANQSALQIRTNNVQALRTLAFQKEFGIGYTAWGRDGARIGLALFNISRPWIQDDPDFQQKSTNTYAAAYPAVQFHAVVGDLEHCTAKLNSDSLVTAIRETIGSVVQESADQSEVIIRLRHLTCSASDIPTQSVELINSTYVAGHNQLANPDYTQLQTALYSAQQELNNAEYNYQANQNFGTGFALGMARGKVSRLQRALAATPPYFTQEVVQQYRYQKYEAYRAYQIEAIVGIIDKHRAVVVADERIRALSEEHQPGTSGVLQEDKSRATNLNPSLLTMEEHETQAVLDFTNKLKASANELVASYFARRASDHTVPGRTRLAASLYLTDLAKGTRFADALPALQASVGSALLTGSGAIQDYTPPNLPIGESLIEAQTDEAPGNAVTAVASALEGVVSIETDAGKAGSGFFVGSGCLVITNEHVINDQRLGYRRIVAIEAQGIDNTLPER